MLDKIVKEVKALKVILALLLVMLPLSALSGEGLLAATTANITVNATPAYVAITCNASFYDFGVVAVSSTTNTSDNQFAITNLSTVQSDQTVSVNATTWTGGLGWKHDDGGTASSNTTSIYSSNGTAWSIIVKNAAPNYIYENLTALQSYNFGLSLNAPTVLFDGAEKSIGITITAAQG